MKKILVTGGAGFIGSNLCRKLVENNENEVTSLDNYFTGSIANHIDGVEYISGETSEIKSKVKFKPDLIFHLGEYSRVEQSFADIEKVWLFNKIGTYSVLEFARESASKIVYAGSSTKFGDGGLGRSQSPYAWTKASNTELVSNFGRWFDLPYAITYFYNAYGDNEISSGKYATLIGLYADKMRKGEKLGVVLPGTQKRNFTHVDDIVSGLVLVGENGLGDEFGIGSSQSFTVEEVAQIFGGEIEYLEQRQGNRLAADVVTSKTESLGWCATRSLHDYIEKLRANQWVRQW